MIFKCFDYDKQFWKIARLTKKDEDYQETLKILKENYWWLKDCFITLVGSSKHYPYSQMPHFVAFFAKTGILGQDFNQKSLDRCFLAANLSNLTIDYLGKHIKH